MLASQSNLANSHNELGRHEEAMNIYRDVYSARVKLNGEEHGSTLGAAANYASCLGSLQRWEEVKDFLGPKITVAQRVLGESDMLTHRITLDHTVALYRLWGDGATVDNLRWMVNTLENMERTVRRVLGGARSFTELLEHNLQYSRAALRAREGDEGGVEFASFYAQWDFLWCGSERLATWVAL